MSVSPATLPTAVAAPAPPTMTPPLALPSGATHQAGPESPSAAQLARSERIRVTVVGSHGMIDALLPARAPIGQLVVDLFRLLQGAQRLPEQGEGVAPGGWTLVCPRRGTLDPTASLTACAVTDGDVLELQRVDIALPAPVISDPAETLAGQHPQGPAWIPPLLLTTGLLMAGALTAMAWRWEQLAAVALLGGIGIAACTVTVIAHLRRHPTTPLVPAWWAVLWLAAVPLAVIGALHTDTSPAMRAAGGAASVAVFVLLVLGMSLLRVIGLPWASGSAVVGVGAVPALVALAAGAPLPPVAAAVVFAGLCSLHLAPAVSLTLARMPVPDVPTAGQLPNDDGVLPDPEVLAAVAQRARRCHLGALAGSILLMLGGAVMLAWITYLSPARGPGIGTWSTTRPIAASCVLVAVIVVLAIRAVTIRHLLEARIAGCGSLLVACTWIITVGIAFPSTWLIVCGSVIAAATCCWVIWLYSPQLRLSPPARRTIEWCHAAAVAVMVTGCVVAAGVVSVVRGLGG